MSAQRQEDPLYRLQRISIRRRWIETFVEVTKDGQVKENLRAELRQLGEEERDLVGLTVQRGGTPYAHDSASGYCGGCRRTWKDFHIDTNCPSCGHLHRPIEPCPTIRRIQS